MVGSQTHKTWNVLNVWVRFGSREPFAFIDTRIERDGTQSITKYPPSRINAARAADVNKSEALCLQAASDKCGKGCAQGVPQ